MEKVALPTVSRERNEAESFFTVVFCENRSGVATRKIAVCVAVTLA